jgi:hypothetical protein
MIIAMSDGAEIWTRSTKVDLRAAEQLLPLVYDELRKPATQRLTPEMPGQTLQATALVHEVFDAAHLDRRMHS